MNWIKENVFASIVLAVTIIGTGALIFLNVQASGELAEAKEDFKAKRNEYNTLIGKPIFPSQANLAKVKEQHAAYLEKAEALKSDIAKLQKPLQTAMTPNEFKDKLVKELDAVTQKAAANQVTLPEGSKFYLGFPSYETGLPRDTAVADLNLVMDCITETVNNLLDERITSIEEIRRVELPVESGAAPPAPSSSGQGQGKNQRNRGPVAVVERSTFAISFTADSEKVQSFLNKMLTTSQLMTVQLVTVENEATKGPARIAQSAPIPEPTEPSPDNPEGIAPPAAPEEAAPAEAINVVLGEEKLKVLARFQIIRLASTPGEKS